MAKRIEKIKLNNVEYNIDSDVLADAVQGGSHRTPRSFITWY